jgi:hypothetical protein
LPSSKNKTAGVLPAVEEFSVMREADQTADVIHC